MERAHAVFEVKSFDSERREIVGVATTAKVDRVGDIVDPKGAKFKLPLPLLWQHDTEKPIGHVTSARVTPKGIEIVAKLVKVTTPGVVRDRIEEAWTSIKHGLVRGLSIGFQAIGQPERLAEGFRYDKWLWLELSAVTIPANAEASITVVRSADRSQKRHASAVYLGQGRRSGAVYLDGRKSVGEKPRLRGGPVCLPTDVSGPWGGPVHRRRTRPV